MQCHTHPRALSSSLDLTIHSCSPLCLDLSTLLIRLPYDPFSAHAGPVPSMHHVEKIRRPRSTVSKVDLLANATVSVPDRHLSRFILQMAFWLAEKKLEYSLSNGDLYQNLITQRNVPLLALFDILCRSAQLTMPSMLFPRSREGIEYSALMAMITENRQLNNTSATPTTLGHGQGHGISCSPASIQLCLDRHLPAALRSLDEDE
ncbi:uncharacterized protein BDR25DRAFT_362160 [Lindgomyces ingoldianus]|uniref:Uncharacterized protein n=1 Tax=Lindgomyces ingoldianus TaxID=673940 RepID=A0ACB6QAP0_9PLEO|nr:uncharacterized protein BDR25DRAFT_362160 [Lindgomyces ingoldianus]KAF2463961.1 hypothetical protein BDR25DRAFT_362160 [Lindgomyces ingoldianus]